MTSGLAGVLFGALVGVLVSVLFEEYLLRYRQNAARRLQKFRARLWQRLFGPERPPSGFFSIGSIKTPLYLVEGDGSQVIDEQRVSVIVDHTFAQLPEDFTPWVEEIKADQARRKERGEQGFWNGPNYAVEGLSISRSTLDELPEVCLRLQESDYFSFLASQQLDRAFPDGTTPRGRYLDGRHPEAVPTFMSRSFGTNVAMVTADNLLVFARRSHRVGSRPNLWSASANEGLSRQLDSDGRSAPDLYRVMRRGVSEELSLDREEYRLELLGFSIDTDVHQWGALFVGTLRTLRGKDVLERRSRGVADKWESHELELIPFQTRPVFAFLAEQYRCASLSLHVPALAYLALVHRYGRRPVERDALKVLGR